MKHLKMKEGVIVLSLALLTACGGGGGNNNNGGGGDKPGASISIIGGAEKSVTLGETPPATATFTVNVTPTGTSFAISPVGGAAGCAKANDTTVTCTPEPTALGPYKIKVTATANGKPDEKELTLTVNPPELALAQGEEATQTKYTDDESATIKFTATTKWTASVVDPDEHKWITIEATKKAAGLQSVNGEVGDYTITAALEPNYTESDRSAVIAIITEDGKKSLNVTITQKNVKEGDVPADWLTVALKGTPITMRRVEPGTFRMGHDAGSYPAKLEHNVTLTKDFYIGKYEVTQAQWKAVMGAENNPSEFQGDDLPVTDISWTDAQGFIKKLNGDKDYHDDDAYREILAANGKVWRLPTEAEWEYAARGGNQSKGYWYSGCTEIDGEGYKCLDTIAWYASNTQVDNVIGSGQTRPVGTKAPNELGIHDMTGNVYEFVNDWNAASYPAADIENPKGPDSSRFGARTMRGGSYIQIGEYVWQRTAADPDVRKAKNIGFRLALDVKQKSDAPDASQSMNAASKSATGFWDGIVSGLKSLWK